MNENLHPQVASLLETYGRDLARCVPSNDLDARIDQLVATPRKEFFGAARRRPARVFGRWAAAACLGTLAVAAGVIIGVRVERAGAPPMTVTNSREPTWPPPGFSMWPIDSVALQIPAEVSARGTLVAVNGKKQNGTRYWVDVVVSNDGTVRIENVVPAAEEKHAPNTQSP
jgi:hypothetical protein